MLCGVCKYLGRDLAVVCVAFLVLWNGGMSPQSSWKDQVLRVWRHS